MFRISGFCRGNWVLGNLAMGNFDNLFSYCVCWILLGMTEPVHDFWDILSSPLGLLISLCQPDTDWHKHGLREANMPGTYSCVKSCHKNPGCMLAKTITCCSQEFENLWNSFNQINILGKSFSQQVLNLTIILVGLAPQSPVEHQRSGQDRNRLAMNSFCRR